MIQKYTSETCVINVNSFFKTSFNPEYSTDTEMQESLNCHLPHNIFPKKIHQKTHTMYYIFKANSVEVRMGDLILG